jgi:hypothetical protein
MMKICSVERTIEASNSARFLARSVAPLGEFCRKETNGTKFTDYRSKRILTLPLPIFLFRTSFDVSKPFGEESEKFPRDAKLEAFTVGRELTNDEPLHTWRVAGRMRHNTAKMSREKSFCRRQKHSRERLQGKNTNGSTDNNFCLINKDNKGNDIIEEAQQDDLLHASFLFLFRNATRRRLHESNDPAGRKKLQNTYIRFESKSNSSFQETRTPKSSKKFT